MNTILENFNDYEFRVSPNSSYNFHVFEKSHFIGILYLYDKKWSPLNIGSQDLTDKEVEQFKLLIL